MTRPAGRPPLPLGSGGKMWVGPSGQESRGSRYKARVRYRKRDGSTITLARFGQTKGEAERRLREAVAEMANSGVDLASASTLADLAAQWLAEDRAGQPWSTNTRQLYTYAVQRYVVPQLGGLRIREASTSVCDAALRRIVKTNGPAAAKTTKAVLNGMFNLAARHDLLAVNPMRETRTVGSKAKQARALTTEDVEQITDGLRSDPVAVDFDLPDLVDFMLATGCRIGEALAVREAVIEADTIEINATVVRVAGNGLIVQERPKTAAGWRRLALPPYAVLMLERRASELRTRAPEQVLFPSPFRSTLRDPSNTEKALRERFDGMDCDHCKHTGYQFGPDGGFLMRRTKRGNLARVRCRRGPFSWVTSHTFRKTVATRLDEAGWSARQIADQLGHAQPSLTLDTYLGRKVVGADAAKILDR